MSRTWALVPLNSLARAKTRLEPSLKPSDRRALMLAMAKDVLTALTGVPAIERTILVSNEPEAGRILCERSLEVFYSTVHEGLNRELEHAAAYAAAQGAERVLILHADLPRVTPEVLQDFIAGCPAGSVSAAGCKLASGTNALLAPLPLPLPLVFGVNSLQRFRDGAAANGLDLHVVEDLRLSLDIDSPVDLERLLDAPGADPLPGAATLNLLERMIQGRTGVTG
ncbi:MAG: 2-phospho-L-lactate guanylyltransferase [Lysobacterales bacterium]